METLPLVGMLRGSLKFEDFGFKRGAESWRLR
jgi:hypothetical protein